MQDLDGETPAERLRKSALSIELALRTANLDR
jgi:hypothetical protein